MNDRPSELEDAADQVVRSKMSDVYRAPHRQWREVLRDVHAVRQGLDGTSGGDSSAYEALERLQQDLRLEMNSRNVLMAMKPEKLLRENLLLKDENERLREELQKLRP